MCVRAEENSKLTFKMKLLEKIIKIFENTNYFCNNIYLRACLHLKFYPEVKLVQDEIIPVYGEMSLTLYTFLPRWNFIPWWKTLKKTCKHFILGWNFKMSMIFINFWRTYLNMLSKINVFEHNESMNVIKHKASL